MVRTGKPLNDATVVLHLVSPDSAGEVDSVRVDAAGGFDFPLPVALDDEDRTQILFASVRHQGILYFGSAIAQTAQLDSLYRIEVFDTETAPVEGARLGLAVRNLVVESGPFGWRVTDLLQIRNSSDRTLVAQDDGVVWSHDLPPAATGLQLGEGDLAPDAVSFAGNTVNVRAPLPPGERLILVRYDIAALPASIPVDTETERMEILVREPADPMSAAPLQPLQSIGIEGNTYRRYAGQNLLGTTITLDLVEAPFVFPARWLAAALGLMLGGLGLYVYYRPPVKRMAAAPPGGSAAAAGSVAASVGAVAGADTRRKLILEVAQIDEALERLSTDDQRGRGALDARRAELLDRLRAMS